MEQRELLQNVEIVAEAFAEADAGIGDQPRPVDSGRRAGGNARFERIVDIERHVVIAGVELHGLGIALGMHQDHRAMGPGHDWQTLRVISQG